MAAEQHSDTAQQMRLLNQSLVDSASEVFSNPPIFTAAALRAAGAGAVLSSQYGLLAGVLSHRDMPNVSQNFFDQSARLFSNTMAPSSTFICGSQGSGKSHTLSCLLENCLTASDAAVLPNPLTALVFHYDTFISDDGGSPCEAAYLSSISGIQVRVLCAPTNLATIKRTYSRLNVSVQPLQLKETNLNTKRMLDLMAVNKEDGSTPLYIHVVNRILREMRMDQQLTGEYFDYTAFKSKLAEADLTPAQLVPLLQRLSVLESFMWQASQNRRRRKSGQPTSVPTEWTNEPGLLTIIDLSCPCITPETSCALFNICLSIFIEQDPSCGRVVALDEAHKYMTSSAESATFTNNLLSVVRLQRHLGARIMVATQEPTVSSALLELCSVTIVHRFTSPSWLRTLQAHLSTTGGQSEGSHNPTQLFQSITGLRTGEALIFAPSAATPNDENSMGETIPYFRVRVRARISSDGGKSVLAQ